RRSARGAVHAVRHTDRRMDLPPFGDGFVEAGYGRVRRELRWLEWRLLKETLINPSFVIPAKAGIQRFKDMDSCLRRNDGLFRPSLRQESVSPPFRRINAETGFGLLAALALRSV